MRNKLRKAELESLVKYLIWIIFFVIAITATYFIIKSIKGSI